MNASINSRSLQYWRLTEYVEESVLQFCKEHEDTHYLGLVTFKGKYTPHFVAGTKVINDGAGHVVTWTKYLHEVAKKWEGKPLEGTVAVWCEDGMLAPQASFARQVPLLCFGRQVTDNQSLLIPDPAFMDHQQHKSNLDNIRAFEANYPWEEKLPVVFWRGANSGPWINASNDFWMKAPRIQLALASKEMNKPDIFDACISKVIEQDNKEFVSRVHDLGVTSEFVPMEEFFKYRYQIDIDGICCAWVSCFMKLSSNAVTLKIRGDYEQWYYDKLVPWQHFVPVAADLSDLEEVIEWLHAHDSQCAEIAAAATDLMETITYEASLKETGAMLAQLFECQRSPE